MSARESKTKAIRQRVTPTAKRQIAEIAEKLGLPDENSTLHFIINSQHEALGLNKPAAAPAPPSPKHRRRATD